MFQQILSLILHVNNAYAFYLQEYSSRNYFTIDESGASITDSMAQASDVKLIQPSGKSSLFVMISLGTMSVTAEGNSLKAAKEDTTSAKQVFSFVLTNKGTFVLKHSDQCVIKNDDNKSLTLGDCQGDKVVEFLRTNQASTNLSSPSYVSGGSVTRTTKTYSSSSSSKSSSSSGHSGSYSSSGTGYTTGKSYSYQ
ncbi:hypothetical protein EHP00_1172 [Ecytonucleospora hepatopenaei]|uniref:Ricin B lectin domain-containing protein n=1 Tax=Ecytonucleospora hepatopenaei TaxID=646526 RepID=A0A1W0E4G8_9MICR|nr:hypothetical protein EHP00_1172 [Ecytonucleospora hepatopenaei]